MATLRPCSASRNFYIEIETEIVPAWCSWILCQHYCRHYTDYCLLYKIYMTIPIYHASNKQTTRIMVDHFYSDQELRLQFKDLPRKLEALIDDVDEDDLNSMEIFRVFLSTEHKLCTWMLS